MRLASDTRKSVGRATNRGRSSQDVVTQSAGEDGRGQRVAEESNPVIRSTRIFPRAPQLRMLDLRSTGSDILVLKLISVLVFILFSSQNFNFI